MVMDPIEGSQDVARKRLHRFRVQNAASIILFLQSAMVDSIRKAELGDILHSSKYAAPRSMVLGFFGTFFLTLVPCVTLLHLPVHRHRHGLSPAGADYFTGRLNLATQSWPPCLVKLRFQHVRGIILRISGHLLRSPNPRKS